MAEISRSGSVRFLLFFASVYLQFIPGFSDDSTSSENSSKPKPVTMVMVLFGLIAVGLFSFFLFKLWQKKKRDEQYARLLKLFEEDDELELELGLRN
ncbi:hypothetical protein V6N11_027289 [Hibiscus sabdariffa]|uniref:Uncharacterized protein n=1 Tax=Hibiscus sabdariffa TaxID=183260 RepID=A0ABR2PGY7_9ROSI